METAGDLDGMRLGVHPGDALVARFPGAIAFVLASGDAQRDGADELVRMIREATVTQGPPGRRLARQVVGWLSQSEPDDVPAFCVLAQAKEGMAAIVHGPAQLTISQDDGDEVLSGSKVATWVDRIIDAPFVSIVAGASGAFPADLDERFNLEAGAVPGGGFTLGVPRAAAKPRAPRRAAAPAKARPKKAAPAKAAKAPPAKAAPAPLPHQVPKKAAGKRAQKAMAAPPPPVDEDDDTALHRDMPVEVRPPPPPPPPAGAFESVSLGDLEPDELRAPLPIAGDPASVVATELAGDDDEVVQGVVCSRGHFNGPSASYCAVCGISMVHRTFNLVSGRRPPLGVVVFDDGATFNLDGGYVLGREPGHDEAVRSGRLRPLVVEDPDRTLSRVHAEIRLEGWDVQVVDRGSANGTFVAQPKETNWAQLTPMVPATIRPGTRVRVGERVFLYDSHHKASG